MSCCRSISPHGWTGRGKMTMGWISTRPCFRMNWRMTASRCRTQTPASATFGSRIASPAAKLARTSESGWARLASPICGYQTATRDSPADRLAPRQRLLESLDAIYAKEIDPAQNLDSVECKLFGLGQRELCSRLARVLSGLRRHARGAALPGRGAFSSHRDHLGQAVVRAAVCAGDAAACEPGACAGTATMW